MSRSTKVTLTLDEFIDRLETAKAELAALAPAPRVDLDRQAVLAMVLGSLDIARALRKMEQQTES